MYEYEEQFLKTFKNKSDKSNLGRTKLSDSEIEDIRRTEYKRIVTSRVSDEE